MKHKKYYRQSIDSKNEKEKLADMHLDTRKNIVLYKMHMII